MPRTFIAFDIPDDVQKRLAALSKELNWSGADIRWVAQRQIHLTLRFLGNVEDGMVKDIRSALPDIFRETPSIATEITHIGAFPSPARAKVIWAGLQDPKSGIQSAYEALEKGLIRLGIPSEERKYSAHVTIGRVRRTQKQNTLEDTLRTHRFEPPLKQKLKRIVFFESTLTPQGPEYSVLGEVSLGDLSTPQK